MPAWGLIGADHNRHTPITRRTELGCTGSQIFFRAIPTYRRGRKTPRGPSPTTRPDPETLLGGKRKSRFAGTLRLNSVSARLAPVEKAGAPARFGGELATIAVFAEQHAIDLLGIGQQLAVA